MDRIEIINDIEKRIEELEQEMQEGMEFLDKYQDDDEPSSDLAMVVELQTKIDILRRVCERAYNEAEPKYRWNSYITLKKIADIFGWDWDLSPVKED